jgi:hypothetical protein
MRVVGKNHNYEIDRQVAEFGSHRIYLCKQEDSGRRCLLQVVVDTSHNGVLDRTAFLLKELERASEETERAYARHTGDPNDRMNYDLCFPEVVDNFIDEEQGGRRIVILGFRRVENIKKVVPLRYLISPQKDNQRVYVRSSVWMMGKLLKLLAFTHSKGFSFGEITVDKVMIVPDKHYIVLFDWTDGRRCDELTQDIARQEISQAAQVVLEALDADGEKIPMDDVEGAERYAKQLIHLSRGYEADARLAHQRFYDMVNSLWEPKWLELTTYDRRKA